MGDDVLRMRPWYIRMWDGPTIAWLMFKLVRAHRHDRSLAWKIGQSIKWGWKYL